MMLSVGMKEGICKRLVGYDKDIVEIIQFGSSVYAPEYARDVDLLVITKDKKEYGGYLDCLADLLFDMDVVVKEVGENLRRAYNILGAFVILYGDGRYLKEMTADFDTGFDDARAALKVAARYMKDAREEEEEEEVKDMHIRNSFNSLFHAARLAAMSYLATENARWGGIKRRLPQPYRNEFEEFINTLHIDYFYSGNYPENYEEAFEKWHRKVEEFVSKLEEKKER